MSYRRGEALPRPHPRCRTTPETPKPCPDHEDSSRYRYEREAWSLRGRTQFRAVGVTARTKKCLKGITCVRFTPKMRVYSLNCVTPAQRNFLPRRLHASPATGRIAMNPARARHASPLRSERYRMWTNPFTSEAIRMFLKGTLALGDDDTHRPGTVVVRVALVGDIVHAGAIVVGVRTCWRRQ